MKLVIKNNIGDCPICGEDLEHSYDEFDDGKHIDAYFCSECELGVTYISPNDGRGEYHQFNDGEIEMVLDRD